VATSARFTSGSPKRRAFAGDDHIAGQRDLQAAGDGEALDRRDQRLARRALHDAREPAAADRGSLAIEEGFEIHPGAESLPSADEHANGEAVGLIQRVHRGRQAVRQRPH